MNGDPSVPVPLTEEGRSAAARLGDQLAHLPIELCVHTRFGRTRETAEGSRSRGRDVPHVEEPLLDDIDVGELEGQTLADYRAWKREHRAHDPFPGGESLDDAARRYAPAFATLARAAEQAVLVVCHEIPIRYALNAAGGSRRARRARARDPERDAVPLRRARARSSGAAARRNHPLEGEGRGGPAANSDIPG